MVLVDYSGDKNDPQWEPCRKGALPLSGRKGVADRKLYSSTDRSTVPNPPPTQSPLLETGHLRKGRSMEESTAVIRRHMTHCSSDWKHSGQ